MVGSSVCFSAYDRLVTGATYEKGRKVSPPALSIHRSLPLGWCESGDDAEARREVILQHLVRIDAVFVSTGLTGPFDLVDKMEPEVIIDRFLPLTATMKDIITMFVDNTPPARSPATTVTVADAPRLTEVGALIHSTPGLSHAERRDQAAAVSMALRIATQADPEARADEDEPFVVPVLTCAYLNAKLFRQPPAAYGLTQESFANMLSHLRKVMRRMGLHDAKCPKSTWLPPAWLALHDALTLHSQYALKGFMHFCASHDIAPKAVSNDTLAAFEAWLGERTLCDNIAKRARAVASNWTVASKSIVGWPPTVLVRPGMRDQYVVGLDKYSTALQEDVARFLARLACTELDDIFPDDADVAHGQSSRRRPLSQATIETRKFQLRQALAAHIILGHDRAGMTCLQELVDPPENAKAIIGFYLNRGKKGRTSQTAGIAEVLRQVACYHAKLDSRDVQRIARWKQWATPAQQTTMSEKNAIRLHVLLQPHNRGNLLHLPFKLMEQADNARRAEALARTQPTGKPRTWLTPHAAALRALYAAALELLLAFPMRRKNLAALHLDNHLLRLGPNKDLISHVQLVESEVKNAQPVLWPLGAESAKVVEEYIRTYRPLLAKDGNRHLFPDTKMGSRAPHDLAEGLSTLVEREIGCRFNVHIARSFAVAMHLERHPGHYETARRMLGHKNIKTTIDYYAGLEINAAARSVDEGLAINRAAYRVAKTAGQQRRRKTPPKTPPKPPAKGG